MSGILESAAASAKPRALLIPASADTAPRATSASGFSVGCCGMNGRRRMTRKAACVLAWALAAAAPPAADAAEMVDMELVLAIDVSESIDGYEARVQRNGYVAALRDPWVLAAIRSGRLGRIAVTYFEWSGNGRQRPVLGWSVIHDEASAHRVADALARASIGSGGFTSISSALDYAAPLFAANGIEAARQVIDVSGDGFNNAGRPVTHARDAAIARGITINGLPVIHKRKNFSWPPMPYLDLYFRNCVIGGPRAFMLVAENLKDFARTVRRKLILEIAGLEPPAHHGAHRPPGGIAFAAAPANPPPCESEDR